MPYSKFSYIKYEQHYFLHCYFLELNSKGLFSDDLSNEPYSDIDGYNLIISYYNFAFTDLDTKLITNMKNNLINETYLNFKQFIKLTEEFNNFLCKLEKLGRFWSINFEAYDLPNRSKTIRFTKTINKNLNWCKKYILNYRDTLDEVIKLFQNTKYRIECLDNYKMFINSLLTENDLFQLSQCNAVCVSRIHILTPMLQQLNKRKNELI